MKLLFNKVQRAICPPICAREFASALVDASPQSCKVATSVHHTSISKRLIIPSASCFHVPFVRNFSSFSKSSIPTELRAYPQYTVYGDNLLAIKIMPPGFRVVKNSILSPDAKRKGRMLLEFAPRNVDGKYDWENIVRFGLSAEEAGLVMNQLPHYKVELSRLSSASLGGDSAEDGYHHGVQVLSDAPEKVLTVEPGEHGVINFTLDYVRDGVGGQEPGYGQGGKAGPICVPVQAGEFEVIVNLMRHSIPYLTGWAQMMDIAMQKSLAEDISTNQGGGGDYRGAGGASDVPF